MGFCSSPSPQDPSEAAVAGIKQSTALQPFQYLINSASTLGQPVTIGGKTYDFSGLGQADTAAKVSDQMAQTLLELQTEKSPQIIQQRLDELKAADPQGYAARQQLFDQILADAQNNPSRPVSQDLQQQLQNELAKGTGFSDAKQAEQAREAIRGGQVKSGVYLGTSPTAQEAQGMVQAGDQLQNQRQQDAMALLQSGASPEDIGYRQMQQNLSNLGNFANGVTPTAQFRDLTSAGTGPVSYVNGVTNTNTFDPNAASQGLSNSLGLYGANVSLSQGQANPWLAGLSTGFTTLGTMNNLGVFKPSGGFNSQGQWLNADGSLPSSIFQQ